MVSEPDTQQVKILIWALHRERAHIWIFDQYNDYQKKIPIFIADVSDSSEQPK